MTPERQYSADIARELHTANQLAYLRQLQHDHEHGHALSELGVANVEWLRTEIYRALGHPGCMSDDPAHALADAVVDILSGDGIDVTRMASVADAARAYAASKDVSATPAHQEGR